MTLACALAELGSRKKKNYVLWFVGLIIIINLASAEYFVQVQVQVHFMHVWIRGCFRWLACKSVCYVDRLNYLKLRSAYQRIE